MQVESLLDEATAELGKMAFSPMLATIEIEFKITKAVPLHTTLRIDCEVNAHGMALEGRSIATHCLLHHAKQCGLICHSQAIYHACMYDRQL